MEYVGLITLIGIFLFLNALFNAFNPPKLLENSIVVMKMYYLVITLTFILLTLINLLPVKAQANLKSSLSAWCKKGLVFIWFSEKKREMGFIVCFHPWTLCRLEQIK